MKILRPSFFALVSVLILAWAGLASAGVVINEVDYDQPGGDTAEFIELYNCGVADVDLTGWTLELVNGTGGGATVYNTVALSGVMAGNTYFVICANSANTVNCDLDITPDTDMIQNGAPDGIGLRDGAGALVDAVSYEGDTGAPYTETSGVGLLDPSATGDDGLSIARVPNGGDTDVNNVDFVTMAITPGAANGADNVACGDIVPVEDGSWGMLKGKFGN